LGNTWMERVLPNSVALAEFNPARMILTRFIPPPDGTTDREDGSAILVIFGRARRICFSAK
jgi:hypothetical protein